MSSSITQSGSTDASLSVGIGSDYDGMEDTPKDLEDVSKYPNLVSHSLPQTQY